MRCDFAGGPPHDRGGFYHRPLGTGDVILEAFLADPRFLLQREQPDINAQQGLGDFLLEFTTDEFAIAFLRREHPVRQPPQTFLELE